MAAITKHMIYLIPGELVPGEFVLGNVLSLCEKHKEQAEVGQSPTLLAICAANGVLRILQGYFTAFLPAKKKNTGYCQVSCIDI